MMKRFIGIALCAAMLAGCAAGAQNGLPSVSPLARGAASSRAHRLAIPVVPDAQRPFSKRRADARATMTLIIPRRQHGGSHRMHPLYISPSTKSIGFWYYETKGGMQHQAQYANVTPKSPGCSKASGQTVCTVTFGAVSGQIYYTVTAYDGTNGSGNTLAAGNGIMTIKLDRANSFKITLDGVATRYAVQVANSTVPAGTPVNVGIAIAGYDADGNQIVNSPKFADGSGGAISNLYLSTPDDNEFYLLQNGGPLTFNSYENAYAISYPLTGIVVQYNGGIAKDATFTVTAGNLTGTGTLHVGAPAGTAQIVYGSWSVWGNFGGIGSSGVTGYAGGESSTTGNMAPSVDGFAYETPVNAQNCSASAPTWYYQDLSVDPHGNVAFMTTPCDGGNGALAAYAPGSSSAAWAITNIPGAGAVTALGFDSAGSPYMYVNQGPENVGGVTVDQVGQIVVYKPSSNGAFDPSMTDHTIDYVDFPEAMAVASDGTVYAAHVGNGSTNGEVIDVFAPGASGSAAPIRSIYGSSTGLATVTQLAVDANGYLYASNRAGSSGNGSVIVFAPGANGNAAPVRAIVGPDTHLTAAEGVGVDGFGDVYAMNSDGVVAEFAPTATGDAAPMRTMQTIMSSPLAIIP